MQQLLTLALIALTLSTYAQTVDGNTLDNIPAEYVIVTTKAKGTKHTCAVNYGQVEKVSDIHRTTVMNSEGKPYTFNGHADVLNTMSKNGWVLVTVTMNYEYIFRKK